MLQATSIYTQGNGKRMLEISKTSLQILGGEIFKQITKR